MGHNPGDLACVIGDPNHGGRCQSIVVGPIPADLDRTRYFKVANSMGGYSYWRSNVTAQKGVQVEFREQDGKWGPSRAFDTETGMLRDFRKFEARFPWREITAEEVPLTDVERFAIAQDIEFDRTYGDAASRYREDTP